MQFYLEGLDAQQASPPWCRPFNFPTQCMPRLIHFDQFNSIHWLERLHYSGIIVCMQSAQKSWRFLLALVAQSYHFQIERPSKDIETWTWNRSLALELNCRGGKRSNAIILSTKTNFRLVVPTKFMHLEDLPCLGKQVKRLIIKEASKAKAILQSIIWSKERSCNSRFVLVAQN